MKIIDNISLKPYNTFGIDVSARHFCVIEDVAQLKEFISKTKEPFYLLGEGSNVLFLGDYQGTVLKMENKGISVKKQDSNTVYIEANAGESWDEFVRYCVENKYNGLENLASIPGKVGSCPIQNVGAYGKEVKDVIYEVKALEIGTLKEKIFTNQECKFGYRTSIFKTTHKNRYIITSVVFKLSLLPDFYYQYNDVLQRLKKDEKITAKTIYDVVSKIREEKLPDCKKFGNAGSFFKNPIIQKTHYNSLRKKYPELVSYEVSDTETKLSAAQLIDILNWKGKRVGDVGVHQRQALVIINYGNASGKDILAFAKTIQDDVFEHFQIKIEPEVNVV